MIVVGSGAAGLAAALAAANLGEQVTVIEQADTVGGSTALSGGIGWFPGLDPNDDVGLARKYLSALSLGDTDEELLDVFATDAARVARALETDTELSWESVPYPDYHSELPGGSAGGRSFEPAPYTASSDMSDIVREAPNVTAPVTYREIVTNSVDREVLSRRRSDGTLTLGRALIGALLAAALDRGVELKTGTVVEGLVQDGNGVTGVRSKASTVDGPVILATGGFERDQGFVKTFLRGPMTAPVGAPGLVGDGLRLALGAGAELGNMGEAWWCPAIRIPGESIDGEPMYRLLLGERARPGAILVDRGGKRFTNEAQNYNDVGRTLHAFDATHFRHARVPTWLIFDSEYRSRYPIGPLRTSQPDPDWLLRGNGPEDLAARIDVPATELTATIERFNQLAAAGIDQDYGRGDQLYDRFVGDSSADQPTLGPVSEPPLYAVEVLPGCIGTKGGPRTDADGRVLAANGRPIDGLFAAGNAAASPFGLAYPGAGATIAQALVFGHRAGEAAAGRTS